MEDAPLYSLTHHIHIDSHNVLFSLYRQSFFSYIEKIWTWEKADDDADGDGEEK